MLVQVGDDAAVLVGRELIEAVDGENKIAFGDRQPGLERPGVLNLVDSQIDGTGDTSKE